MIKLFYGNTIDSCTDSILSSLKQREKGRFCVVLAPDSNLFAIENMVAEEGFALDVEVMSFSRLAKAVLKNKIKRCLTPEGCNMIMTRAIHKCKDKLVYYKKSIARNGFVNEMYSTITALRNSGIGVNDLSLAVGSMSGYVQNKTRDLITIYNAYLETLSVDYSDPTTRLEALTKEMYASEFIKETAFYIVDFYTFNHKEYEVLEKLLKYAYSVSIGVIDAVGGLSPKSIYPTENTSIILKMAEKSGNQTERVNCYTALNEYQRFIANDLFGLSSVDNLEADIDIELINPLSSFEESALVSKKICELVRKGARYKDIAVVKGDENETSLETAFNDYGIPYYVDKKVPLTGEPSIKYLLLSMSSSVNNYEKGRVFSLLKNPLSLIDDEEGMLFENYCDKYAINYTRFLSQFTLGSEWERKIPEKVRSALVEQIITLPKTATVSTYIELIKEHLKKVDYQTRITDFFDKQVAKGDFLSIKRTAQIPKRLVESLNLCGELLSDYELSDKELIEVLQSCLEAVKLSIIPLSADCVTIGASRDSKFENIDYLFITNCADGKIPQENVQGTILTNKYHTDLQSFNMVVRPKVKEENQFAKFALTGLLLKAKRGLYISCPQNNGGAEKTIKSELFEKFKAVKNARFQTEFTLDKYSSFVTSKQCMDEISLAISKSGVLDEFHQSLLSLLSVEEKSKIYNLYYERDNKLVDGSVFTYKPNKNKVDYSFDKAESLVEEESDITTVSKIENFYSCPYQFFIRYGLKAKEREEADVQVNELGSFIHSVLDKFFGENKNRIDQIDYDHAKLLALEIAENLLATDDRLKGILQSGARRIENLKYEASLVTAKLNELAKKEKFRPFLTEAEFDVDEDAVFPPILLENGTRVRGKIDRIDLYDNNIVVIDYKTGNVKPKLTEVFFGEKIQLYIYLYALKSKGYRPVAAFYQHIDAGFTKEDENAFAYKGQFINSPDVIDMFDPEFKEKQESEILPLTTDKKGNVKVIGDAYNKNTMLSEDAFQNVIEYSKKLIEKADKLIKEGYIEAKPLDEHCKYCKAKNICSHKKDCFRKKVDVTVEAFNLKKDETLDT